MEDVSHEKIARNDSAFRDANDEIDTAAVEHGFYGAPVPFLCECSEPGCTQVIRLTREQYAHVRSNDRWFAHAVGHEAEIEGAVRLVERHEGYIVVEKIGRAGALAAQLAEQQRMD
ncbi:MAG: hypothetical protein JOZ73_02570 [Solirubrobacterales bacterium]|nr:hypothetical protein [Solirubrobacterales bacterium]